MRIVITGAEGFIGRNLRVRLNELGYRNVVSITRAIGPEERGVALRAADFVFHLAGVNRPQSEIEFITGNVEFTQQLCSVLGGSTRRTPVVYASSSQAALENPYGLSKRGAEEALARYSRETAAPIYVFRLNNVFGKWCRPHYNSVVATFCHQIARSIPVTVKDPDAKLRLIYVDDVVSAFIDKLSVTADASGFVQAEPVYDITVGELARTLQEFAESRTSLKMPRVGTGLLRALYSTYISYLPVTAFAYDVPRYGDPRGMFVEMLKTPDCGQFSYFTAKPGITRGEHYHHSKVEKFLVLQGTARFSFRSIDTGETHDFVARGGEARIIESVPGWVHSVTNIGDDEMFIMLWAHEVFDRSKPDTIAMKVTP